MKGYVTRLEKTKTPFKMDWVFGHRAESAMIWESREDAEVDCAVYNNSNVEIPSSLGETHICRNFTVEEMSPGKFAIFCEAPFIPRVLQENQSK